MLIEPRTLPGFRDFLPETMMAREKLMETARRIYRSYGFSPIDTPALEYSEILLGKGSDETDKQMFRFQQGKRDVAMRFDLTVPLARYSAQHIGKLGTPFKRYHIAPVWRAERPQRGRYREFVQCDFDTIGTDANASDIETLMVIHDLMEAIGFERFTIRVNHRQLLNGVLEQIGLLDQSVSVLRALDKLPKIGRDKVVEEMERDSISAEQANRVLDFAELQGTPDEILAQVESLVDGSEIGETGLAKLRETFATVRTAGIDESRVQLDVSIARGLDYYTGTIYETFLGDLPDIGSVCSGGRYDNLAGLYTKEKLPGVGASLGLDRLLAAMEELGLTESAKTPASVMITLFDKDRLGEYMGLSRRLRSSGVATEVYPFAKKLQKQFQYADKKGFQFVIVAGSNEFEEGVWTLKDLSKGEQETISDSEIVNALQSRLGIAVN